MENYQTVFIENSFKTFGNFESINKASDRIESAKLLKEFFLDEKNEQFLRASVDKIIPLLEKILSLYAIDQR